MCNAFAAALCVLNLLSAEIPYVAVSDNVVPALDIVATSLPSR